MSVAFSERAGDRELAITRGRGEDGEEGDRTLPSRTYGGLKSARFDATRVQALVEQAINLVNGKATDDNGCNRLRAVVRECGIAKLTFDDAFTQQGLRHYLLELRKSILHLAVYGGRPLAVACLLEEGADVNTKDSRGLTPLDLARNYLESLKQLNSVPGRITMPGDPSVADLQKIVDILQGSQTSVRNDSAGKGRIWRWLVSIFGHGNKLDNSTIDDIIQRFREASRKGTRDNFPPLKAELRKCG